MASSSLTWAGWNGASSLLPLRACLGACLGASKPAGCCQCGNTTPQSEKMNLHCTANTTDSLLSLFAPAVGAGFAHGTPLCCGLRYTESFVDCWRGSGGALLQGPGLARPVCHMLGLQAVCPLYAEYLILTREIVWLSVPYVNQICQTPAKLLQG